MTTTALPKGISFHRDYDGHWIGEAYFTHHAYGVQVHRSLQDAERWLAGQERLFIDGDINRRTLDVATPVDQWGRLSGIVDIGEVSSTMHEAQDKWSAIAWINGERTSLDCGHFHQRPDLATRCLDKLQRRLTNILSFYEIREITGDSESSLGYRLFEATQTRGKLTESQRWTVR